MVKVNSATLNDDRPAWKSYIPVILPVMIVAGLVVTMSGGSANNNDPSVSSSLRVGSDNNNNNNNNNIVTNSLGKARSVPTGENIYKCPYASIDDLAEPELHPAKGMRHMVDPPAGGPLTLVCCKTTKGVFNTLVHEKWAPKGAQRFLDMVKSGYFESGVPLMRCIKNFLCQFGLNNNAEKSKIYRPTLEDDPNWLPEGPTNRENEDHVKRFAHGYMAYAGGGKNTRNNQFIIALKDQSMLAGGSPWEVPWGEIVGSHSFETWSEITVEYGEKGPPQGQLMNRGMTEEMKKEYPNLDYITGCNIVDERLG